ncbi:unnamed protein product [Clonostachys rhizophaga]|uniref:RING-type domain-containing protein n=1 Tax=Clonostachys rhizophaga TaxID=160324 RepID=A0A9N9VSF7_9HYPO|nr:unnamed protein product [Clonostachys rhizophaga]
MSSQTSAQASRVERQHSNRSLSGNVSTNRTRVDGHSRRNAAWSSHTRQNFHRATGGTETYVETAYVSAKPPPNKRVLLSLEEVEISELPEDERTCIICYNDFGDESPEGHAETPRRLPECKHVFGDRCIKKWLHQSENCPYCRATVGYVRASDLNIAHFAEVPRESSDDEPDELVGTFFHIGGPQLQHMPVYTSLGMPRTMEERERHRIFLLRTREAQMREAQMREAGESPSRSPVEREDILDTPPPRASSDMDPTVQTPTHSRFHREDMMATPPSTAPRLAAQQGPSAPTMPEQNPNIPRPGPVGGNGSGSSGTNSSTQTVSSNPGSPHANPVQNISVLADFTFDSYPDLGPAGGPLFLPSLGSGASHGRSGRGRRC